MLVGRIAQQIAHPVMTTTFSTADCTHKARFQYTVVRLTSEKIVSEELTSLTAGIVSVFVRARGR